MQNFKNILRVNREYCCLQAYLQAYTHTYRHIDDSTPNILTSFDSKMVNKLSKNELYRYLMSQFYDYVNFHSFDTVFKIKYYSHYFLYLSGFCFFYSFRLYWISCTCRQIQQQYQAQDIRVWYVRQNFLLKNIKSSMLGERPT